MIDQRIDELRRENPTLTAVVNGETVTLGNSEYEATLREWAENEAAAAAAEAERQEAEAAREAARVSARARLASQGWTDAEIDVTYPTLVQP